MKNSMTKNLIDIPSLKDSEIKVNFLKAKNSIRKRVPKIIHQSGDYENKVFNFMLYDTYMQPHLHPGKEKTEKMYLVLGSFILLFFDNFGKIIKKQIIEFNHQEYVEVPPYIWHTYIMLTEKVIVYETMDGIYNDKTWKEMASWAPIENSKEALVFFNNLRQSVCRCI